MPTSTYLFCMVQRSSSNLLCEALARTGVAGIPTEYFTIGVSTAGKVDLSNLRHQRQASSTNAEWAERYRALRPYSGV